MVKINLKPKSWADFVDFKNFKPPKANDVSGNVEFNLQHYQGNYLCVLGVVCVITAVFFRPFVIFLVLAGASCGAAGYFKDQPLKLGSFEVHPWHKMLAAALISVIALIATKCQNSLFYTVLAAATLILTHAALQSPKLGSKLTSSVSDVADAVKSAGSDVAHAAKSD